MPVGIGSPTHVLFLNTFGCDLVENLCALDSLERYRRFGCLGPGMDDRGNIFVAVHDGLHVGDCET